MQNWRSVRRFTFRHFVGQGNQKLNFYFHFNTSKNIAQIRRLQARQDQLQHEDPENTYVNTLIGRNSGMLHVLCSLPPHTSQPSLIKRLVCHITRSHKPVKILQSELAAKRTGTEPEVKTGFHFAGLASRDTEIPCYYSSHSVGRRGTIVVGLVAEKHK